MNELNDRILAFLGWSPTATSRFSLHALRDIVRFANLPEGFTEKARHELIADIERAIRTGAYVSSR